MHYSCNPGRFYDNKIRVKYTLTKSIPYLSASFRFTHA